MTGSAGPNTKKPMPLGPYMGSSSGSMSPGMNAGKAPAGHPVTRPTTSSEAGKDQTNVNLAGGLIRTDGKNIYIGSGPGQLNIYADGTVELNGTKLQMSSTASGMTFDTPEFTIANEGALNLTGKSIKIDGGEGDVNIVSGEGTVGISAKSMSLNATNSLDIDTNEFGMLASGDSYMRVDGDSSIISNGRMSIDGRDHLRLHSNSDAMMFAKQGLAINGHQGVAIQSNKHMSMSAGGHLQMQATNMQGIAHGGAVNFAAGRHMNLVAKTDINMMADGDTKINASGMSTIESNSGTNILSSGSIRVNSEGQLGLQSLRQMFIDSKESSIFMHAGKHFDQTIKGNTSIRRHGKEDRINESTLKHKVNAARYLNVKSINESYAGVKNRLQSGGYADVQGATVRIDASGNIEMQMGQDAAAKPEANKSKAISLKLLRRKQPSVDIPGRFPEMASPLTKTTTTGSVENEKPGKKHNKQSGINTSNRTSSGMAAAGNVGVPCGGASGPGTALGKDGSAGANKLGGLNQKLITAYNCAEQRFESETPFKVNAFSGVGSRGVASSKHPSGDAVDVVITGTDGVPVNNLRSSGNAWRIYEVFAYYMKECYDQNVGDNELGWGGWFSGGSMHNDTMHFEVTSRRDGRASGARDWATGEQGQGRDLSCFGGRVKDCKDVSGIPTEGAALNSGGSGKALGKDGSNGALNGGGCGVYGNEHSSDRWGNMPNTIGDKINRVKGVFGKINCGASGSGKATNKKQDKATKKEYTGSGQTPATGYVSPSNTPVGGTLLSNEVQSLIDELPGITGGGMGSRLANELTADEQVKSAIKNTNNE